MKGFLREPFCLLLICLNASPSWKGGERNSIQCNFWNEIKLPPTISIGNTHIKYINLKISTFGICQSHEISAVFMQFHLKSNPDPLETAPTWSLNTGGNSIAPGDDLLPSKHIAPLSAGKYTKAMQCQGCIVLKFLVHDEIWNLNISDSDRSVRACTPWLTARIAAAAELRKHCSITSCKSTCWSLFNFPFLNCSAETGHSQVHLTKQVWGPVSVLVSLR